MDRFLYYMRFICPVAGTMSVVLCFILSAPVPVLIGMITSDLMILLCADPFNAVASVLAPQTRHIITCCTIIDVSTGYIYYYCHLLAGYDLPAGIAIFLGILTLILLFIAGKLNKAWLDRYQYLDCREVSCALVENKEYKYIRYWDSKGRRICRSLLDMHLGRKTSDDEMEYTMRHVFIAGMASGDEYSTELLTKIESLQEKLDVSKAEQKKLQDHIDTIVKRKVEAHEDILLAENAQQKKRIAILSDENKSLSKSLKEAQKVTQKAENARQEAEKECEQLQKNLEYTQDWASQMETELKKMQQQIANNEYIGNLQDEYIIMQSELEACQQNLNKKSQLLSFREEEILQLKQQLDQAVSKLDQITESEHCHLAPVQMLPIRTETPSKGGRPPKLSREQLDELLTERRMGTKINELAKKYGVSKSTISQICKSAGIEIDKDANVI